MKKSEKDNEKNVTIYFFYWVELRERCLGVFNFNFWRMACPIIGHQGCCSFKRRAREFVLENFQKVDDMLL